ncbi:hypothetical protein VTN96DRAFT_205 [Rasamsonia emersonii]
MFTTPLRATGGVTVTIKLAERVLLPGQSAWPAQDPLDSLELPPICVRASPLSPDRLASLAWRCLGDNSTSALGVVGAVSLLPRGVWQESSGLRATVRTGQRSASRFTSLAHLLKSLPFSPDCPPPLHLLSSPPLTGSH